MWYVLCLCEPCYLLLGRRQVNLARPMRTSGFAGGGGGGFANPLVFQPSHTKLLALDTDDKYKLWYYHSHYGSFFYYRLSTSTTVVDRCYLLLLRVAMIILQYQ